MTTVESNITGTITVATTSGKTTEAAISDANDIALFEVTSTDGFSPKAHQRKVPRTLFTTRPHGSLNFYVGGHGRSWLKNQNVSGNRRYGLRPISLAVARNPFAFS